MSTYAEVIVKLEISTEKFTRAMADLIPMVEHFTRAMLRFYSVPHPYKGEAWAGPAS